MATVVPFDRRRRYMRRRVAPTDHALGLERLWRSVVLPFTAIAGAGIVIALILLTMLYVTGSLPARYNTLAEVLIVVAIVGLTKILFANAIFYAMIAEERAEAAKPKATVHPAPAPANIRRAPARRRVVRSLTPL